MTLPPLLDRGVATPAEREALAAALAGVLGAMADAGMLSQGAACLSVPLARTLTLGSKGEDVGAWQNVIGARRDNDFGPETQAKTREWAAKNAFGLVGEVSAPMWLKGTSVVFLLSPGSVQVGASVVAPPDLAAAAKVLAP